MDHYCSSSGPDPDAHPSSLCGKASNDKSKNVKDAAVATSKTIMGTVADRNGSRNPNDLP